MATLRKKNCCHLLWYLSTQMTNMNYGFSGIRSNDLDATSIVRCEIEVKSEIQDNLFG